MEPWEPPPVVDTYHPDEEDGVRELAERQGWVREEDMGGGTRPFQSHRHTGEHPQIRPLVPKHVRRPHWMTLPLAIFVCIVASTLWAYAFVALPTLHWARFASMGAMLASLLFAGRWVSNMVTWATRREM